MNCCKTVEKVVVFSLIAILGLTTTSSAQDASEKKTNSTAKIFGGRAQYRTWSLGLNAGILTPDIFTGASGNNHYSNSDINLGYGLTIRKQLAHSFGLELSGLRGNLSGSNKDATGGIRDGLKSFKTEVEWAGNIMGVVNVATIDFLRRENNVNFLVKAGFGMTGYSNSYVRDDNSTISNEKTHEAHFPVGVGIKFRISDRVNFDLGHTMFFLTSPNLDGGNVPGATKAAPNGKYSYSYGGLELSLGSSSKPNLDWVNPVALMYDELKDPSMRKELDELKKRVGEQDSKIEELSKDKDGDGVSDKFDKCPNTESGVKVDGGGCPLDSDGDGIPDSKDKCPTQVGDNTTSDGCPDPKNNKNNKDKNSNSSSLLLNPNTDISGNVQFDFDSSILKTSSYPVLDQLSSDIKAKIYTKVRLEGHASIEGTDEHNMQLSIDRANSVKTYLVNAGIPSSKVSVKGFGRSRPIAFNDTEEGRSINRRVEITKK